MNHLFVYCDAHHCFFVYINKDGKTYDTDNNRIWETFGVVNSNEVSISNCIIHGSSHMFAVFFAGPRLDAGQATIDGFNDDNLDKDNVISSCTIYSDFEGDVLSFSLQQNGAVINNVVNGGVISFFMNKDSVCNNNQVIDSNTWGIFVSVPAENNVIDNNVITNSRNSGIKVARQIDHLDPITNEPVTPLSYRASKIFITNNQIENARFFGLEIDQTKEAEIKNNQVSLSDYSGIYLMHIAQGLGSSNCRRKWI